MSVTIRQIAEMAGVSRGTVDRVLNERPGVKSEVREKVLRILEELQYQPNIAAKALALSKNPIVFGIIMPPQDISFFQDVRCGIDAAAEELKDLGIKLEFRYLNNSETEEAAATIYELIDLKVSGIMFSAMDDQIIREAINHAVDSGIPVITFNSDVEDCKRFCFIGQDLYKSGRIAAGLMNQVVRTPAKIIVLTGNMKFHAHRTRVMGFRDWFTEHNPAIYIVETVQGYDRYNDTLEKMGDLLSKNKDIDGIYMATGHVGACIEAMKQQKLTQKTHVISNDLIQDVEAGMKEGIIDFTIVQNPFEQGYRTLRLLYEYKFMGKKPEKPIIFTETSIKILENI